MAEVVGMTYKVLSLFSGCGGMDLGIEGGFNYLGKRYSDNRFSIIQALDFDPRVVEIYNENFKKKMLRYRYIKST